MRPLPELASTMFERGPAVSYADACLHRQSGRRRRTTASPTARSPPNSSSAASSATSQLRQALGQPPPTPPRITARVEAAITTFTSPPTRHRGSCSGSGLRSAGWEDVTMRRTRPFIAALAVVTRVGRRARRSPRAAPTAAIGVEDGVVPGVMSSTTAIRRSAVVDGTLLTALRSAAVVARTGGVTFVVNSGWRSRAYQQYLLDQAVITYGSLPRARRWVATLATSPHVSGKATTSAAPAPIDWLDRFWRHLRLKADLPEMNHGTSSFVRRPPCAMPTQLPGPDPRSPHAMSRTPDPRVKTWLDAQSARTLYLTIRPSVPSEPTLGHGCLPGSTTVTGVDAGSATIRAVRQAASARAAWSHCPARSTVSIRIPFTGNYSDLSNNDGYQFEFRCERCGNGFRSGFQRDMAATGQSSSRVSTGRPAGDVPRPQPTDFDRSTNSEAMTRRSRRPSPRYHRISTSAVAAATGCDEGCWNDPVGQSACVLPNQAHELAQHYRRTPGAIRCVKDCATSTPSAATTRLQSSTRCPSCGTHASGGGSVRHAVRRSPSRRPAGAARTATRSARSIVSSANVAHLSIYAFSFSQSTMTMPPEVSWILALPDGR